MDWASILIKYGVQISDEIQFDIVCPFHHDNTPSLSINVERGEWHCHAGCGGGKLEYFISKFSGKPWKEIETNETWEIDFSDFEDKPSVEEEDSDSIIDYGDNLVDIPSNHWIFKRGFTKSILDKWDCKVNSYNDLVIPIKTKEGTTSGWITRRIQATPKYMYSKGLKKSKLLYGINHLQSVGTLYIVEGALDAMWMDYHGYPTVAILGARISKAQVSLIRSLYPSEVVLCLDNDEAGQRGIDRATLDMEGLFMLSYINIPDIYKDLQEIPNKELLKKVIKNKALWRGSI